MLNSLRSTLLLAAGLTVLPSLVSGQSGVSTLTVNSDGIGAFVRLGDESTALDITDPMGSTEWSIAFFGTDVVPNGGEGGPGGWTAYCVCQNREATDEEVQAMTPESELEDFLAVDRGDVPAAGAGWHPSATASAPWYEYNLANQHLIWPNYNVYLFSDGEDVYKVQVIAYYGADGTPRQVTFRYARV